ncbi:MAG: hypothetical protein SNJ71_04740 [Bacteroidales bacterium]
MKKLTLKELRQAISELNREEYSALLKELNEFDYLTSKIKVKTCIYCNSEHIIKHGRYNHLDRYRCKDCGKTFIPTTGTVFYYIQKKHIFLDYFKILHSEGIIPLAKIKKRLDIANQTAFDWRHKILMLYSSGFKALDSDVFIKQRHFRFSQKGRKNIAPKFTAKANHLPANVIVAGNSKSLQPRLSKLGELENRDLQKVLKKFIKKKSKVLLADNPVFSNYFNSKNYKTIEVRNLKTAEAINLKKLYSSNLDLELSGIINKRLRGVATKYLQVYSNFLSSFVFKRKLLDLRDLVKVKTVWFKFIQIERMYVNFIVKYSGIFEPFDRVKRFWKNEDRFHHLEYGVLIGVQKI